MYNMILDEICSWTKNFSKSMKNFTKEGKKILISEKYDKTKTTPEKILNDVFGYKSFRPMQKEIIQNILDGRDTLAVLPTGGGKSLCYEIPALIMKGMTVVVSPLIALMQDQVSELEAKGIEADFLNSSLDWESYIERAEKIREGKVKIVYTSPEALNTQRVQEIIHSSCLELDCITIDEAHCISSWGHDFRPDYLEIANLRHQFPKTTFLALTATATVNIQKDIIKSLHLENPEILVASFNRPNIFLEVKRKTNAAEQILEYINEHKNQSGIIYCFSRKGVEELTNVLKKKNISAINYHAGLTEQERSKNQEDFIKGIVSIMVCTLAFGMGINKSDVRFVIHHDLPKSIEQYYQEIGRAGRDGKASSALLLYSPYDAGKIRYFFKESSFPEKEERLLQNMLEFAIGTSCRRKTLLSYFGERNYSPSSFCDPKNCCDICRRKIQPLKDFTIPVQKFLSCILRTGERFGTNYIIDILEGAKTKRIIENAHNKISTWGIGKEYSKEDWQNISLSLLEKNIISKSDDLYSVLSLTPKGKTMLKERALFYLTLDIKEKSKKDSSSKKKLKEDEENRKHENIALEEEIRKWRRKKAEELKVAPFVIFSDKTLFDIACIQPSSEKELMKCYGIGKIKLEKFSKEILKIVKDFSL